ncbi:GNAT family N-acetyltransferase [Marinobacter nauticus]|uniref:GNAT family N-acetyltransferase n=1 Tax=Marinobacter nauticus TaxID=2743 RepID=UPI00351407A5
MSAVRISEFVPQDNVEEKKALLPVFLNIWNTPDNLKYLSQTLIPLATETVQTWFEEHRHQGGRYFCALDERNSIVGVMVVKENPVTGFEIYGLGVLPERKGEGIGRMLVKHAAIIANADGFTDIKALVFTDNKVMLCLLISLGYTPISIDHHIRSDGADAVWLQCSLV